MRYCLKLILLLCLQLACTFLCKLYAQTCPPNIDFEMGSLDGWTCYTGFTEAIGGKNEIRLTAGPPEPGRHTILSASAGNEVDPYGNFPVNCPNGSGYTIMLGNNAGGHEADGMSYEFTIPANQNSYRLIYHYAVVFQQPRHQQYEQPRMEIEVTNVTDNAVINCASFTFIAFGSTLPGFKESTNTLDSIPVLYKDWTAVSVDLSGNAGKTIKLFFKTSDCTFNRHFGYAYIDINTECDGKITGAEYCPDDTVVNIIAPYGYQDYKWYNESQTQVLGNQQILTVPAPALPNIIFAVRLTPYFGYGCSQTLLVQLTKTLTVKAEAGPDTLTCNYKPVRLGRPPKPGLVYSWEPPDGLANPNTSNPFASPAKTTHYYLTARNSGGGCVSRDTVLVRTSVLKDSLWLLGKDKYCIENGDSAVLLVAPTDSITWFKNNTAIANENNPVYRVTSTGTYFAVLRNNDGCVLATNQKAISITTIPKADFSLNSSAQCLTGNKFAFTNNSSNALGAMQYQWTAGDGAIYNSQHLNYSYPRAGKYDVGLIVSSSAVCADTAFTSIEVYQNAVANFTVKPSCINLPLQITNNTADTLISPVHYLWTYGNAGTSTLRNPESPAFASPGNYNISLAVYTDQCPSPAHIFTQGVTIEKPRPNVSYPVKYALSNVPIRLQARRIGETALWLPAANLDNNSSFTPLFTGLSEQLYQVAITTASGCVTVDTQLVKTVKEVTIAVPTAFTPNRDGLNDLLRPTVFGIKQFQYFKVFNRWGQLVFQTSSEGAGWDGNFKGLPQATQTFMWMAAVIGGDDKQYTANGTSVLLR